MATDFDAGAASEGIRERKRRQTRQRIAEAGLRLFLERGFEATTLDAIAEAADIARRTFFHYFDSKEAILTSLQDAAEDSLRASIEAAPIDQPPFEVVCAGMLDMISGYGTEEARSIDRLLRSTETLRARKQSKYEQQELAIFAALCTKWPDPALRMKLRLTSLICVGSLRLAADAWSKDNGQLPLKDYLIKVFDAVRDGITG
jgi:AcrR family transcriptional regulator